MNPKTPPSKVNRLILEEASEWFVEFRVGDVDAHARASFDDWLRRSPDHIRAYIEIAKTYVELPSSNLSGSIDVNSLIAYAHSGENIVIFNGAGTARPNAPRSIAADRHQPDQEAKGPMRSARHRFLAAASIAFLVMIAGAVWWQVARFPTFATGIGERRSLTLADGSMVDLNARSRLRIEFSKRERRVELLEGQVLFQVSKDKSRPFIVSSGDATVRAVGTQFDVYRKAIGTTVTVLEGRVAVYSTAHLESTAPSPSSSSASNPGLSRVIEPPAHSTTALTLSSRAPESAPHLPPRASGLTDSSEFAAILVSAGEQVTVTPTEVTPPQRADMATAVAWMERRLVFDGTRLSDVVQEFNRNDRRQLIIEGTQLSDFHVSGVYSSIDPASLIRFLRDQPGIKITEDEHEVLISVQ